MDDELQVFYSAANICMVDVSEANVVEYLLHFEGRRNCVSLLWMTTFQFLSTVQSSLDAGLVWLIVF
jgi:hypothetical protein